MALSSTERQAKYRGRMQERLRIADRLIRSVESGEEFSVISEQWRNATAEPKQENEKMSLQIERTEVERKSMFKLPKWSTLALPEQKLNAPKVAERTAETFHEKVFRLVGERKIEEAARLAARLINSGDVDGFFIYGGTQQYRRAEEWFKERVSAAKRGQSCDVETVTPQIAQILLINNDGNRRVNAPALSAYIRDILDGRWELNGETFKVSREGLLNDAQHRSFGVLISGTPIKSYVAFGVARETIASVDIGRKRTSGDRLAVRGESDYIAFSSISSLSFEIESGRSGTAAEVDEYFTKNADDIRAAHKTAGTNIKGLGPSVAGAASLYLIRLGAKQEDINKFFKTVRTGDALKNDAARAIYDALYPKAPKPALKMKKTAWVSTLVHHFIRWRKKAVTRNAIIGEHIPESL